MSLYINMLLKSLCPVNKSACVCVAQMGQALWRLPPRQQQQLQEELAGHLAEGGGEPGEQSKPPAFHT